MNLLERKNNIWLFVAILLACFAVSVGVRYQQFETWKKAPTLYFVDERPLMTTLDAPYWLRWAREYNEGNVEKKDGYLIFSKDLRSKTDLVSGKISLDFIEFSSDECLVISSPNLFTY